MDCWPLANLPPRQSQRARAWWISGKPLWWGTVIHRPTRHRSLTDANVAGPRVAYLSPTSCRTAAVYRTSQYTGGRRACRPRLRRLIAARCRDTHHPNVDHLAEDRPQGRSPQVQNSLSLPEDHWLQGQAGGLSGPHGLGWLGSGGARRNRIVTWSILPVVICLSQRLSHACLSISKYTVKLRMAH